jgi:hypothetical protein
MDSFVGDLPTWIAAAVAVIAAAVAWTQWKDQKSALERDRRREHREHASQLSAWIEKRMEGTDGRYRLGVRVHNFSDLTFSDLEFTLRLGEQDAVTTRLRTCPPGDIFIARNSQNRNNPHYSKYPFALPERIAADGHGDYQPFINSSEYRLTHLSFSDNSGVRWTIDEHGVLTEQVPAPQAPAPQAPAPQDAAPTITAPPAPKHQAPAEPAPAPRPADGWGRPSPIPQPAAAGSSTTTQTATPAATQNKAE